MNVDIDGANTGHSRSSSSNSSATYSAVGGGERGDERCRSVSADEAPQSYTGVIQGMGELDDTPFDVCNSESTSICTSYVEANSLRAIELGCLSYSEREQISNEIHGVADPLQESNEIVTASLSEFRLCLRRMTKKTAYNKARLMSPTYVDDVNLHLMALRSEKYNASLAACRYVSYFDLKLDLFGLDSLVRPITRADLSDDDLRGMEVGYFQIMNQRDQSGRAVAVIAQERQSCATIKNKYRMIWYLMMKAIENDEDVQRNGFVGVVYNVGADSASPPFRPPSSMSSQSSSDPAPANLGGRFASSILARFNAVHYCYDSIRMHPALAVFQFSFGRRIRLRFRSHYGSHTECQYALMSFGLPMFGDFFPIGLDGSIRLTDHASFVSALGEQDTELVSKMKSSGILYVTSDDVLLGKGRAYQEFPGNMRLRDLVDQARSAYQNLSTTNADKTRISNDLVRLIQVKFGGRFLRRDNYGEGTQWEVVDNRTARAKIAHAFRSKQAPAFENIARTATSGGSASSDVMAEEGSSSREVVEGIEIGSTDDGKATRGEDKSAGNNDGTSEMAK